MRQQSMREQLTGAAAQLRQRSARVQPVSQVGLQVRSADPQHTFAQVRHEALLWMKNRAGKALPSSAWDGGSFELHDVGAQRTAAVALAEPYYWAGRIDDADKDIPQRTWITELGIGVSPSGDVLFGCRLYCVALGDNPPFVPSIPGLVRQVARKFNVYADGRRVATKAWRVESTNAADQLVAFLRQPDRQRPVVVISLADDEKAVFAPDVLAHDVLGSAHVVTVSLDASYRLTDLLGKEFSVFNQAVRTYRPGFHPDTDEPSSHPLALADAITHWHEGGAEGFKRFLVARALRYSVARRDLESELPSFSMVQALSATRERERAQREGQSDAVLLKMAIEDIDRLKADVEEKENTYQGILNEAEQELELALRSRDEARAETARLRARIEFLEQAVASRGGAKEPEIPESLTELESWAEKHLSGSVVILNRAYRAAKKSAFANPQLVYRALLILRDLYVPMRREGGLDKKQNYEQRLHELGLEETPSFSGSRAGEQGDDYFVEYGARKRELDRHLKGSNARDERYGFRLYFFWDDDSRQVVVGWLPSHLETRAS